jgi:hypothetical protein
VQLLMVSEPSFTARPFTGWKRAVPKHFPQHVRESDEDARDRKNRPPTDCLMGPDDSTQDNSQETADCGTHPRKWDDATNYCENEHRQKNEQGPVRERNRRERASNGAAASARDNQ